MGNDQRRYAIVNLSVVMPAYEEAANLAKLLPRLHLALAAITSDYEILVVDTHEPRDETPDVCERHDARYVARQPGDTYGDAVRSGISAATGEWVILMDSDGSHPPEFVKSLYEQRAKKSVIIASRYIRGGGTQDRFILRLMSRTLNVIYSTVLGLKCRDVSNSFRLYDGEEVRQLRLRCQNFDIVEEVLVKLKKQTPSTQLIEVPFQFQKRDEGVTKRNLAAFILTYLATLWRLKFSNA